MLIQRDEYPVVSATTVAARPEVSNQMI